MILFIWTNNNNKTVILLIIMGLLWKTTTASFKIIWFLVHMVHLKYLDYLADHEKKYYWTHICEYSMINFIKFIKLEIN